jgi:hypothetical protein
MATYQQGISNKLTALFQEADVTGDLAGFYQQVNRLVLTETERSFRSGIRWAQQRRARRGEVRNSNPVADSE